ADSISVYYQENQSGYPDFNANFSSTNDNVGSIYSYSIDETINVSDFEKGNQILTSFNTSADGSGTMLSTRLEEYYTCEDDEESYVDTRNHSFQDGDRIYAIWKNKKTVSLFQDESVLDEGNESEEFQSITAPEGSNIRLNSLYSISVENDGVNWSYNYVSIQDPDDKILVGWKKITSDVTSVVLRIGDMITDAVTGLTQDLNLFGVYKDKKDIAFNPGEGASFASGDAVISAPTDGRVDLYVNGYADSVSLSWNVYDVDGTDSYMISSSSCSALKRGYVFNGVKSGDTVLTSPDNTYLNTCYNISAADVDSLELLWEEGNLVRFSYDVVARDGSSGRFANNDEHTCRKNNSAYVTVQKDESGDYYAAYYDKNKNQCSTRYLNTIIWGMGKVASDYVSFYVGGKGYNLGELAPVTNNMSVTLQTTPVQTEPIQTPQVETSPAPAVQTEPIQTPQVVTPPAPAAVYPSSVSLNAKKLVLEKGKTSQLIANIAPANANDLSVSFASDDTKVATVDAHGVVTAKSGGNATITATTSNGLKATCEVYVATIKLNATSTKLQTKHTSTALIVERKTYSKDSIASVSSSNEKIVKASFKGSKITLKSTSKTGKAKVTVKMKSGATASCTIYVQKNKIVTKKLSLNYQKETILTKKTLQLEAERNPITATEKITWSSSDNDIATVNSKGKVTAKKSGKVTITAKTSNGVKASCKITVKNPKVKLRKSSGTVKVKKTLQIQIKSMYPSDDEVKSYKSSNKKVAKVNKDGTVLGVKKGTATITVTMKSGAKATFKVKVK
ncbi:MAG: Ig-like domain-containing protein, partial [Lachnospiraceae bacterium]|nr:Ig-like domain-containing protein [Lachnospiraceae bacterium]